MDPLTTGLFPLPSVYLVAYALLAPPSVYLAALALRGAWRLAGGAALASCERYLRLADAEVTGQRALAAQRLTSLDALNRLRDDLTRRLAAAEAACDAARAARTLALDDGAAVSRALIRSDARHGELIREVARLEQRAPIARADALTDSLGAPVAGRAVTVRVAFRAITNMSGGGGRWEEISRELATTDHAIGWTSPEAARRSALPLTGDPLELTQALDHHAGYHSRRRDRVRLLWTSWVSQSDRFRATFKGFDEVCRGDEVLHPEGCAPR